MDAATVRGGFMRESALLHTIGAGFREALGANLKGLYLHGSMAFGCFHWETGDIDLIAVAGEKLSLSQKVELLAFLVKTAPACPPKGIEMSVVLAEHCRHFVYPTPYELHFSQKWAKTAEREPLRLCGEAEKTDADLAAHFTVIRKAGIALFGPPARELFGPVPRAFYKDSILRDIQNAPEDVSKDPVYVILNLCRCLAFFTEGLVVSKEEGGQWALRHGADTWHPMIRAALASYATGAPALPENAQALLFAEQMLARIGRMY